MSILFRLVLLLSLLWSAGPPLLACAQPSSAIKIQLRWTHQFQFAGYYAAIEKGFYAEEGLAVELLEYDHAKGRIAPVLSGEAEYGVGDASLIKHRLEGEPVVLLTQIFQHSPLVFISKQSSGIYSPFDMAGKKVMFNLEDAPLNAIFKDFLAGRVPVEKLPHSYDYQELIDGKVDVISGYLTDQPFRFRQRGIPVNIIDPRSYGIDFYGDNLFTSERELREHPQRPARVVRATLRGWNYALQHPDEIIELIRRKYNPHLDLEQLRYEAQQTAQMIMPQLVPLGRIDRSRYERILQTYRLLGVAAAEQLPEGFIYQPLQLPRVNLSLAQQEWIARHPRLRLAFPIGYEPFLNLGPGGEQTGMIVDFARLLEQRLGLQIEIVATSQSSYRDKLAAQELDGVLALYPAFAQQLGLLPSRTYLTALPALFANRERIASLERLEQLAGKRVTAVAPATFVKELLGPLLEQIELVEVGSQVEAMRQVFEDKADVMFGLSTNAQLIAKYHFSGLATVRVLTDRKLPVVVGVRPELQPLVEILNLGLASISEAEKADLLQRWFEIPESSASLTLSTEEQQWLSSHPVVRVAFDADFAPVEYFDAQGQPQGISVSVLRKLESLLGVRFEFPRFDSWEATVAALRAGELEMASAVQPTEQRKTFLDFTRPYLSLPVSIFAELETPYISDLEQLRGKRVAVVASYPIEDFLRRDYPGIELVSVPRAIDGLQSAMAGKVDAYIGSLPATSYYIAKHGLARLKIVGETPYSYQLSMAARSDRPYLHSILEKGLAAIPTEERNRIAQQWFSVRYEHHFDPTLLWQLALAALLLFGLFAYWNRRLKQEVLRRSAVEQELREAKEEAELANRAKSTFLANMSHELRTPLTAIIGYAHLLGRQQDLPEKARERVATIDRSGQHLVRMINDVLEVSKIEAGQFEIKPELFEPRKLFGEIREMFLLQLQPRGVRLELELSPQLPELLQVDLGKLRQILINLVGNACKFTEQGEVRIRADYRPRGARDGELEIQVADTGPGIAEAELDKLFLPFEQGSSGRQKGGTGLGLVISRKYARLLEGDLTVSSRPGAGSCFTLQCRAGQVATEASSADEAEVQPFDYRRLAGRRIMIVDDDAANRSLLADLLQPHGVEVISVDSGEAAVEQAQQLELDLILMDIGMPGIDGFEAIRRLKNSAAHAVPIIVATAGVLSDEQQKVRDSAADGFVGKPIDVDAFFAQLGRLL